MKRATWLLLTAMALPLSIPAANAAVNPDKLPQVPCSDVKFSAAFLAKWPKAPVACQDARVYKGVTYAKFVVKVYISSPEFMTFNILDSAGNTVTTASMKPGPNQGVHVNGKLREVPRHAGRGNIDFLDIREAHGCDGAAGFDREQVGFVSAHVI